MNAHLAASSSDEQPITRDGGQFRSVLATAKKRIAKALAGGNERAASSSHQRQQEERPRAVTKAKTKAKTKKTLAYHHLLRSHAAVDQ